MKWLFLKIGQREDLIFNEKGKWLFLKIGQREDLFFNEKGSVQSL
jgi:hypothetical protein